MEARHHAAHTLRDFVNHLALRTLVSAAESHERVRALQLLRVAEGKPKLVHDLLRDRIARHRHTSAEHPPLFQENQVRRARTDVYHQRALRQLGIIVANRVVQRHRSHIHQLRLQPRLLHGIRHLLDNFRLDRREHNVNLAALPADELAVPYHFVNRERHILLRFVQNDLVHLVLVHGRQLDEAQENRLS